jgi:hypothetical protein
VNKSNAFAFGTFLGDAFFPGNGRTIQTDTGFAAFAFILIDFERRFRFNIAPLKQGAGTLGNNN